MREKEILDVENFEGLYDVEGEHILYNLQHRRRCWFNRHDWTHASLQWDDKKSNRSIELFRDYGSDVQGLIRLLKLCRRCKEIECVHYLDKWIEYRIRSSKFYYESIGVGVCKFCALRIRATRCGVSEPSQEALTLMNEVMPRSWATHERDVPIGSGIFIPQGWGSGWYCEMPVAVSQILDSQGRDAAEVYIRNALARGSAW